MNYIVQKKMIEFENAAVGYGKKIIVPGLDFEVGKGEIFTLIGPNGAGKSTVLKTLVKQLGLLGGKISVAGKDFSALKVSDAARKISMVMTERIDPELMTCREVVSTGRYPYTGKLGVLSKDDWLAVDKAIATVHGEEISCELFSNVSDGQRQRIMLARAICQDTDIIVLDEPTSYLDLFYKLDLLRIIRHLAKDEGKTIIMSLHELDLVKMISDSVICVNGEKAVRCGTVAEIFSGNFLQELYGLEKNEFDNETGLLKKSALKIREKKEVHGKARVIMVQGTMSNAGKSLLVAGLCRVFKNDGFKVAPFKSQNMALNSFITKDGFEMGRAQVMQAEACGIEPSVEMNPVLLKPTSDKGSQVIVMGEVLGNMSAVDYFAYKKNLVPRIMEAFGKLSADNDIIVIEGAGSPAEINLRENDIVNMGLAELVDAPVLLVGDIDRGGVFAQLYGTVGLLEDDERKRIRGMVINKFRGDKKLLQSGIDMIERKCGIPVTGVLPYLKISVDDEDSLSDRFEKKDFSLVNIGVVRFPRISNFTDFDVFERIGGVAVHYILHADEIEKMDMMILPGSKNTIGDLKWMRENGIEAALKKFAGEKILFGICGGFQMLGKKISDPDSVEEGGEVRGMELLDCETILQKEKTRRQVSGNFCPSEGFFDFLGGRKFSGYEIHMGKTLSGKNVSDFSGGACCKNIFGTYIHGIFDEGEIAFLTAQKIASAKGISLENSGDYRSFREKQYDILADAVRENLDMESIYEMMGIER